ncbi:unnamed protein product [Enterobius vermicularis]|uniref:CHK domain-containing protein n=1 Tax=Enterobius vermicularis TaxID=51028 RepID=A0A0N4VKT2_ENTVE|nr:unnamed protein product [Enterobius vermicularis]
MANKETGIENNEKQAKLLTVPDTSLPAYYVEEKMQEYFKTLSQFGPNLEMSHIGIGQGFLSVVARIIPDWTPSDPNLPKSFIAKVSSLESSKQLMEDDEMAKAIKRTSINVQEILQQMEKNRAQAHNTEVAFYRLAKKYELNLKMPEIYFAQELSPISDCGLLFMEDAGETSYVIPPYEKTSVSEVKQVLQEIAKFHSYSLKHPEVIKMKGFTLSKMYNRMNLNRMLDVFVKSVPDRSDPNVDSLCENISQHSQQIINDDFLNTLNETNGMPPVLVHGDLWSFNILWYSEKNEKKIRFIIDWQSASNEKRKPNPVFPFLLQLVHCGCIVEDIVRYIACAMSVTERRQFFDQLLQYYYEELEKSFGDRLSFTCEQLKQSAIRMIPLATSLVLNLFGALSTVQIQKKCPDREKELTDYVRKNALGLLEDMWHYFQINQKL